MLGIDGHGHRAHVPGGYLELQAAGQGDDPHPVRFGAQIPGKHVLVRHVAQLPVNDGYVVG